MKKVQRLHITLEILTKADQPLQLSENEQTEILEALESAVQNHVDLRYTRDYSEERHELLAVDIMEVTSK